MRLSGSSLTDDEEMTTSWTPTSDSTRSTSSRPPSTGMATPVERRGTREPAGSRDHMNPPPISLSARPLPVVPPSPGAWIPKKCITPVKPIGARPLVRWTSPSGCRGRGSLRSRYRSVVLWNGEHENGRSRVTGLHRRRERHGARLDKTDGGCRRISIGKINDGGVEATQSLVWLSTSMDSRMAGPPTSPGRVASPCTCSTRQLG